MFLGDLIQIQMKERFRPALLIKSGKQGLDSYSGIEEFIGRRFLSYVSEVVDKFEEHVRTFSINLIRLVIYLLFTFNSKMHHTKSLFKNCS